MRYKKDKKIKKFDPNDELINELERKGLILQV